jgi:hypothetical protein
LTGASNRAPPRVTAPCGVPYAIVVTGLGTTKETRDLAPWVLGIALVVGTGALLAAFAWGQRVP